MAAAAAGVVHLLHRPFEHPAANRLEMLGLLTLATTAALVVLRHYGGEAHPALAGLTEPPPGAPGTLHGGGEPAPAVPLAGDGWVSFLLVWPVAVPRNT